MNRLLSLAVAATGTVLVATPILADDEVNLYSYRQEYLIQPMLDRGEITEDEARTHPMRNVLTRSVGVEADVEVSRAEVPIESGDRIVLCSDGLSDLVPPALLLEKVMAHTDLEELATSLVDSANAAGGHDNISVVIVQIGSEQAGD